MAQSPDASIATRSSLLSRLKNWDDQESWKTFFDTYWRLIDQLRKRRPASHTTLLSEDGVRTATVERIPDPNSLAIEAIWDDEYERHRVATALERVKRRVNATDYQIFDC
jgi:hypothetical protein